jgi:hypothetical protein
MLGFERTSKEISQIGAFQQKTTPRPRRRFAAAARVATDLALPTPAIMAKAAMSGMRMRIMLMKQRP